MVKQGSRWIGNDGKEFVVIHCIELEGKVWVHYRDQKSQEYSCYEEAFVCRFGEMTNSSR